MSEEQPTPAEPKANDSLDAWIQRAKRAHELVDAVDLHKVTQHDQEEVGKLSSVGDALDHLSVGKDIDHVEGVDEVVEELDAAAQRKAELFTHIAAAGWSERLGRVLFVDGESSSLKPLELIPHRKGLPDFDICIAPEQVTGVGNFAILVSAQGVFSASVNEPSSKHHWRIVRSRPYESLQELYKTIAQFSQIND